MRKHNFIHVLCDRLFDEVSCQARDLGLYSPIQKSEGADNLTSNTGIKGQLNNPKCYEQWLKYSSDSCS